MPDDGGGRGTGLFIDFTGNVLAAVIVHIFLIFDSTYFLLGGVHMETRVRVRCMTVWRRKITRRAVPVHEAKREAKEGRVWMTVITGLMELDGS
jgi:hypothetical protein